MAYLDDHPPAIRQWYEKRNRVLTGCTVLHSAEGVLDTIGLDTGAEATADFIRRRTTAGSYHDLVDSDSWIPLVDLEHGAFHDGTGSNNWALSLSFACRTTDWRTMSAAKRAGFLRQGAKAFAAQQQWRKARGYPLTELRLISKAQSDAGMSGFTYHGLRDPSRRTDPGTTPAAPFPFAEFIGYCAEELRDLFDNPSRPDVQEDDMQLIEVPPGKSVTIANPLVEEADVDIHIGCDNPTGQRRAGGGVIESVPVRIALQESASPIRWRPVGNGHLAGTPADAFTSHVPLGASAGRGGRFYAASILNGGELAIFVTLARA